MHFPPKSSIMDLVSWSLNASNFFYPKIGSEGFLGWVEDNLSVALVHGGCGRYLYNWIHHNQVSGASKSGGSNWQIPDFYKKMCHADNTKTHALHEQNCVLDALISKLPAAWELIHGLDSNLKKFSARHSRN